MLCPAAAAGQVRVTGRVTETATGAPLASAIVSLEGTSFQTQTGADGQYRLDSLPPGPQTVRVILVGYAPLRQAVLLPAEGSVSLDLVLAKSALQLPGIVVTADPVGRARGELTTASVIEREAIRNQAAASLAGLLELIPGVTLSPPGLDGVQQISLRAVAVSTGGSTTIAAAGQPSANQLAAFGTQIVLDGIPVSNNANFQTLGPRGELGFPTSAGGGVDLRRFPAATIERVEVIRGVPSVRYGDLTQGAILVDTRAGKVAPEVLVRLDSRSLEASVVGGDALGTSHLLSGTLNLARTLIAPGQTDEIGSRFALQLAHRYQGASLTLDSRLDAFQVLEDRPEIAAFPGVATRSREGSLRLSERARLQLGEEARLEITAGFEGMRQRSFGQEFKLRGAQPFTNALTEGRHVGKYVGGAYLGRADVEGDPRHLYLRPEFRTGIQALGGRHTILSGAELRREWNTGAGLQFDIEFPPQSQFNGVNGYDRPRRLDSIPPLLMSALYLDDRVTWILGRDSYLSLQGGIRLDLLHEGGSLTQTRDIVLGPRATVEFGPQPWLRARVGAGRLAKAPTLMQLYPGVQYHDLVNVNYFANNPAERLAVITTRILDRGNPELGFTTSDHLELGLDLDLGSHGGALALAGFLERTNGAVGFRSDPTSLIRDRYALDPGTIGTGQPPEILEPPIARDSVPVLIDRPSQTLTVRNHGVEMTATTPEIPHTGTRIALNGSWTWSQVENTSLLLNSEFSNFQVSEHILRAPYWLGSTRTGELLLLTTRFIHQQPELGIVITATVQATLKQRIRDIAATDTLGFAGYLTRGGTLVPVPPEERGAPEYADLRVPLKGQITDGRVGPNDWLLSLQVSKTLPLGGRFAFYAFNALDRIGNYGDFDTIGRLFPRVRVGLEVTMPLPVWQ